MKAERLSYGDLEEVLANAEREHAASRLSNAIAAYPEAMGQCLRVTWIKCSGKTRTSIKSADAFMAKLRASGAINRWTFQAIERLLSPPIAEPTMQSADIIAGIVKAVCADRVSGRPVEGKGVQS